MKRIALFLVICALVTAPALADIVTTTADLPPDGPYVTLVGVFATYTGADLQIVLQDVVYRPIADSVHREIIGADEFDTFASTLSGITFENSSSGTNGPFALTMIGPSQMRVINRASSTVGRFDAEIVSMNLSGELGGEPVLIRESPTVSSMGMFDIADLGGGLYHIDSFFDVFTEWSIDGGASWIPADGSVRMELVPAPGAALLGILGLGMAGVKLRRKHA